MDSIASSCNLNSFEPEMSNPRLVFSSMLRDSLAILSRRCALLYPACRVSDEGNSSCRSKAGDIAALVPLLSFMRASISERKCCDAGISFPLDALGKHVPIACISLQKLMLGSSSYSIGTRIRSVLTIINQGKQPGSSCANDRNKFFLEACLSGFSFMYDRVEQLDKFTGGHYAEPLVAGGFVHLQIRRNGHSNAFVSSFGNNFI
jgi:hypothetical protein